ncbi:Ribokinase [Frankliniella fusca]|uniref:Ribokinase n=1 Tax=Frankliniella fusca TaxID=407009 RepID=A0AAE1GSC9_9NEOP|nr:Ribokinase [Frankliniella fusca]
MALTKIVVVGSCMTDLNCYAKRLPKCGETLTGDSFTIGFGGKGANQCVAAARIGGQDVETTLVARVGDDSFGANYLANLEKNGIDTRYVKSTPRHHTGVAQISVSETGENTIIIVPGANTVLSPEDVRAAQDRVVEADVALFQFETPIPTTLEALRLRRAAGKGISIVNAAPVITGFDADVYKLCDIFCVNETEAELLTGVSLSETPEGEALIQAAGKAANVLLDKGCHLVILTLGKHGSVILDPKVSNKPLHIPARSTKAVDTTGAGDAFLGALAFFLGARKDLDLQEQVRRAMCYATLSVEKLGTQDSFPYRESLPAELL